MKQSMPPALATRLALCRDATAQMFAMPTMSNKACILGIPEGYECYGIGKDAKGKSNRQGAIEHSHDQSWQRKD
jgi:hypothetical protein